MCGPHCCWNVRRLGSTNSFRRGASASFGRCCLPSVRTEIEYGIQKNMADALKLPLMGAG